MSQDQLIITGVTPYAISVGDRQTRTDYISELIGPAVKTGVVVEGLDKPAAIHYLFLPMSETGCPAEIRG